MAKINKTMIIGALACILGGCILTEKAYRYGVKCGVRETPKQILKRALATVNGEVIPDINKKYTREAFKTDEKVREAYWTEYDTRFNEAIANEVIRLTGPVHIQLEGGTE